MLAEFVSYIQTEGLFQPDEPILLAVSGGVDSVVMTDLFYKSGYTFGIAHINFLLRKAESYRDEDFVRGMAERYKVPFYLKRVQTKSFARENKLSVQMAARRLRFEWFDQLINEQGYHYVATAHHLDDQIETFLINLTRGTGIAGLHGIRPKTGRVIRPLMFAGRKQVEALAMEEKLPFVEDSSNASLKYTRNRIRHRIIPQMERINPSFRNDITETISHIRDAEIIYRRSIDLEKQRLLIACGNGCQIPVAELKNLSPGITWLYELISVFNFSPAMAADIWKSLEESPGKTFFSPTHRLVKDRDFLLIDQMSINRGQGDDENFYIDYLPGNLMIEQPLKLHFSILSREGYEIPGINSVASLDIDKIRLPLILRRWKKGDYFYPYGMSGTKKLSDYFIDHKFSIPQKEKTWLLCSGSEIIWIIGHRIDDRYKVDPATRSVLQVTAWI